MALPNRVRYKASYNWESPDDGNRYEVIDGELFVSPAPNWDHQRALSKLNIIAGLHVYESGLGELVQGPVGVELDDDNGVQPDIIYISREWMDLVGRRGVIGAPDLVVEALSPSTRALDRVRKMRRYAQSRVPHYWLLDPRTRSLLAHRLVGADYELTGEYGPGSVFRPELFPGLEIPIDELWS
jgi:Uma2 family endonuclease